MSVAAAGRPPRSAGGEYMRWYRRTFVDRADLQKRKQSARDRALRRLAQRYPVDLRELVAEELRNAGIAD